MIDEEQVATGAETAAVDAAPAAAAEVGPAGHGQRKRVAASCSQNDCKAARIRMHRKPAARNAGGHQEAGPRLDKVHAETEKLQSDRCLERLTSALGFARFAKETLQDLLIEHHARRTLHPKHWRFLQQACEWRSTDELASFRRHGKHLVRRKRAVHKDKCV